MGSFITKETLKAALGRLAGSADHMLKIWLTLKQMGMSDEHPVSITTSSPDNALFRLFDFGHEEGLLFVPFGHSPRFMQMKQDAGRSIIQTNMRRWATSGSVVNTDPSSYMDIFEDESGGALIVKPGRNYLIGLGQGRNGFARDDNERVAIPAKAFAAWYFRETDIEHHEILALLRQELNLSNAEYELIFVEDNSDIQIETTDTAISKQDIKNLVALALGGDLEIGSHVYHEDSEQHSIKVRSMTTQNSGPAWLSAHASDELTTVIDYGARAILLYGPPRTGKTHTIDKIIPRSSKDRITIQIHDGWGYDELIGGYRFGADGEWAFEEGVLAKAIRNGTKYIILEELNRTEISQALGELFSLIETAYRGEENSIEMRDGSKIFVPKETVFFFTMNTLDRSTEEIDDALLGRLYAVECPPKVEVLHDILTKNGISGELSQKVREFFVFVGEYYPLGHGYFADLTPSFPVLSHYKSRIRPVLQKQLEGYRDSDMRAIDEKFDSVFCR